MLDKNCAFHETTYQLSISLYVQWLLTDLRDLKINKTILCVILLLDSLNI